MSKRSVIWGKGKFECKLHPARPGCGTLGPDPAMSEPESDSRRRAPPVQSAGASCRPEEGTYLAEKRLTHKVTALGRGYFTCDFQMHLVIRSIVEEIDEIGAYVT